MKNKLTYKSQLSLYNLIIILVIIIIQIIYASINNDLISQYNNSYSTYAHLGDFYDHQANAHKSFKNYLYTKNKKEYTDFLQYTDKAENSLEKIINKDHLVESVWRFQLLDNMLISYSDQAKKVKILEEIKDENYAQEYDRLLDINEMINKTSDDYYQLVTKNMEKTLGEVESKRKSIEFFSFTTVIIGAIGILLFTRIIRKRITNPIDNLVSNMDDIKKGTFNLDNIEIHNKEMEVLCLALQDLSNSHQKEITYEKEKAELKNKLLLQENDNLKKDELLATSELKILQSSINPHFLFNAMNMIYQQAIIEKSTSTIEMIEKMTECMRYTMSQSTRISALKQELNFVKNYIFIQNKRFEGRIKFELEVEDNLPNIKIPAMIIEPLIDNSIKHGLANVEKDGMISIHVSQNDNYIKILVSDNGIGMNADKLEELVGNGYRIKDHKNNLGLYNLSRRLSMHFLEDSSISINSFEGCGFETLITIPILEEVRGC